MRQVLSGLLRYGVFVVLVMAGAAAAVAGTSQRDATSEARARLALTNKVEWPFYDAARDRQTELLSRASTLETVQGEVGPAGRVLSLSMEVPPNQTYVDIVARADTRDAARVAADAAATYLVEQSRARAEAQARATRDQANAKIQEIDASVDGLTTQLEAVDRRLAELQPATYGNSPSPAVLAEFRLAEDRRDELSQRRSAERARRVMLVDQLDRANFELGSIVPEVDLLRSAQLSEEQEGRADVGLMALAAAGVGLIALLGATGYDARFARLRNRQHAVSGAAHDVAVVAHESKRREPVASIEYVSRLIDLREPGEVMGVASAKGNPSTPIVQSVANFMSRRGRSVVSVGSPLACPDAAHRIDMRILASFPHEPAQSAVAFIRDCLGRAQHVHIAVDLPYESVDVSHALRRVLQRVVDAADLVIVDCGLVADDALWNPIARVCDLLIIAALPKLTRQSDLRRALRTANARDLPVAAVALGTPKTPFATHVASVVAQTA